MKKVLNRIKLCLLPMLCMLWLLAGCSSTEYIEAVAEAEVLYEKELEETSQEVESGTEPGEGESQKVESGTEPGEEDIRLTESHMHSEQSGQTKVEEAAGNAEGSLLDVTIDREGSYTTAEDVALYIYTYQELPQNFMTKKEAKKLGWSGGSLEAYAPGMCIGGDYFGNYEGLLPKASDREYHECDIDTLGAESRGAKRIVYSNDGLIYYTEDHYDSFTLLYGEE